MQTINKTSAYFVARSASFERGAFGTQHRSEKAAIAELKWLKKNKMDGADTAQIYSREQMEAQRAKVNAA
jgi:hypothetical protein